MQNGVLVSTLPGLVPQIQLTASKSSDKCDVNIGKAYRPAITQNLPDSHLYVMDCVNYVAAKQECTHVQRRQPQLHLDLPLRFSTNCSHGMAAPSFAEGCGGQRSDAGVLQKYVPPGLLPASNPPPARRVQASAVGLNLGPPLAPGQFQMGKRPLHPEQGGSPCLQGPCLQSRADVNGTLRMRQVHSMVS
eukprot:6214762-Pleurochrysis_carterae.AAC.2